MSTQTTNYNFVKQEATEEASLTIMNGNLDSIDEEIKNQSDKIGLLSVLKTLIKTSTVAAINELFDKIGIIANLTVPVGTILYNSKADFNPNTIYSGTTWVRIKDKFLLAAGDTYTAGTTGGETTHALTVAELPQNIGSFNPLVWSSSFYTSGAFSGVQQHMDRANTSGNAIGDNKITLSGGGQAHNNMPPYIVVYVWERTA